MISSQFSRVVAEVEDRWSDLDAVSYEPYGPIGECVYCSRLIGSDPSLVLHGGGNSSVKHPRPDVTGGTVDAIYVKGSGWDMASIEAPGLAPLDLARLRELLALDALSDPDMVRELAASKLDPAAPNPSVESLLHAFLPYRAIQHSHADVIINLTNLGNGDEVVREVYGDDVVVIPYVMPGFDLARTVREMWSDQAHDATSGMVLLNHGLFTFGDDSVSAYRRHVDLIGRAQGWLEREAPEAGGGGGPTALPDVLVEELARLRAEIATAAGRPMIMRRHTDSAVAQFVARDDLASVASRGPLTPDHVIRTKPVPMLGAHVDAVGRYGDEYRAYVDAHRERARTEITEIDPAPRIVLDSRVGMLAIGGTATDARIAADIYHHTIPVITRAEDHLGGYVALSPHHLFDMEYWDLEQAKLRLAGASPELAGSVALVTGAASGIGRACANELIGRGSAIVALDIDPAVVDAGGGDNWLGLTIDVTDALELDAAIRAGVERFGGVDIVVVAAGVFGPSTPLEDLAEDEWRRVMAVNVDSVQLLFNRLAPLLAVSPIGGRVVVIGSKNVPAPGMGAAAYSASKAALQQLCRVAALEWAEAGVRVNSVHPDGVFDTGLWSDELIADRADTYGLTPDEYKRRNLLSTEITSARVARSVVALCTDDFAATTGAQVPIDGGNDRVI
jgi:rhamnose utilization protein RhaD (predicted bifunctional aldolase and dehydrogenase)/NAD(P)-dependent dehydrogenase (short-subunit alcohol dehydrogenase family)